MRNPRFSGIAVIAAFAAFLLSSCVGLEAKGEIRADGSGTVALDYVISRYMESLGKLEDGGHYLPFPSDRAGFDRLAASVPGLSLDSFSRVVDEDSVRIGAAFSFASLTSFAGLLEAAGRSPTFTENGGKRSLVLRLSEGDTQGDADLKKFVDNAFPDLRVSLRLAFPAQPSLSGAGSVEAATRSVVYASKTSELLTSKEPLTMRITW